ncbi:MAG: LD-carboxypeptidase [Pseudomonadota bacterium]|nr:LD-carboxypeptidase [Pseudomonadota bacterium]
MRIAVVAPSCRLQEDAARRVEMIAFARGDVELAVHPQCFESDGHFAGKDSLRLSALREVMADPTIDAVWFARGGYGSNRIAEAALADLPEAARTKIYVGYSDAGFLLAGLHKVGCEVAHGPMVQDVLRAGGDAAVDRTLDWLVRRDPESLESNLDGPAMAFNLTVLSSLLGTPLEPDFAGVDLLIEDVAEHLYRIDRTMFHLTGSPAVRHVRRLRLGRVSDIPDNDPMWSGDVTAIVVDWCARAGIPFAGGADIGHDVHNRVVPFPLAQS